MRLVNLPGVLLGVFGVCALSGAVSAQDYSEWGEGYPGWCGAYPYPYAPSYGYGRGYAPGYPPHPGYPSAQPPTVPYPGEAQAGSGARFIERPYDPAMAGLPEDEQAALNTARAEMQARLEERRRAFEAQREALRAALEKRHVDSIAAQPLSDAQPITPSDSVTDYRAAAMERRREMQARHRERRAAAEARRESSMVGTRQPYGLETGPHTSVSPEEVAANGSVPLRGEVQEPSRAVVADPGDRSGGAERGGEAGDQAPITGLDATRRPTSNEPSAALEERRQAIQQRREEVKAAVDARRGDASAPAPTQSPAAAVMPPPATVEATDSGDADSGDVAGSVEKRRVEGESAPMGLGLPAPESTAAPPEG